MEGRASATPHTPTTLHPSQMAYSQQQKGSESVDVLRMSTPTSPMTPHQLGGDMIESEALTWNSKVANACVQEGNQEEEEQLPLFYQVPLPRLLSWSRWWHITSRALLIAFQRRFWGLTGNCLKEVTGAVNPHLALVRARWGGGRGRLLRQLSAYAPK